MVTKSRWDEAQSYEKGYWETEAKKIKQGLSRGLSWYAWRAENLVRFLKQSLQDDLPDLKQANVLEVGSGPVGIVAFLEALHRVAVDPLADYYRSSPELSKHRSVEVEYLAIKGEDLPFDSQSFDLVIIDNVIDHVLNAQAVVTEIKRILKQKGILYLTVNLHPMPGAWIHRLASGLHIDRGHPHTFTLKSIRRMLHNHGFIIQGEQVENFLGNWWKDLTSASIKSRLKALTGLSEYLYASASVKNHS